MHTQWNKNGPVKQNLVKNLPFNTIKWPEEIGFMHKLCKKNGSVKQNMNKTTNFYCSLG